MEPRNEVKLTGSSVLSENEVLRLMKSFEHQALDHKADAARWMLAVIVSAVAGVLVGAILVSWPLQSTGSPAVLAYQAAARLGGLVMVGLIVRWCDRNYLAHRHNYIVNRFRANVLGTLTVLLPDTEDVARERLWLTALRSAFRSRSTGYQGIRRKTAQPRQSPKHG